MKSTNPILTTVFLITATVGLAACFAVMHNEADGGVVPIGVIQGKHSGCMFSVLLPNEVLIDLQVSEREWKLYHPGMTYPTKEINDLCSVHADTSK